MKFQRPAAAPAGSLASRLYSCDLCTAVSVSIISRPISNIHSCTYIHSRYCYSCPWGDMQIISGRLPQNRTSSPAQATAQAITISIRRGPFKRSMSALATYPSIPTRYRTERAHPAQHRCLHDASFKSNTRSRGSPPCWLLPPNPLQTRQSITCRSYCLMDMGMHMQRRGSKGAAALLRWNHG